MRRVRPPNRSGARGYGLMGDLRGSGGCLGLGGWRFNVRMVDGRGGGVGAIGGRLLLSHGSLMNTVPGFEFVWA